MGDRRMGTPLAAGRPARVYANLDGSLRAWLCHSGIACRLDSLDFHVPRPTAARPRRVGPTLFGRAGLWYGANQPDFSADCRLGYIVGCTTPKRAYQATSVSQ